MSNSSIWLIDRTLSGALGQSGPGSDGNEGVLSIPQNSSITRASQSDCLVSYQDTRWSGEGSYSSAEMQSLYSTVPADWADEMKWWQWIHRNEKKKKERKTLNIIKSYRERRFL